MPSIHPYRSPPLIHLPLSLPASSASILTPWLDLPLNLSAILPFFQSLPRHPTQLGYEGDGEVMQSNKRRKTVELPSGKFAYVSYVRVYANCRVRRIWFVSHLCDLLHSAKLL